FVTRSARGEAAKPTSVAVVQRNHRQASACPSLNHRIEQVRSACGGSLWSDGDMMDPCGSVKPAVLALSALATRPNTTQIKTMTHHTLTNGQVKSLENCRRLTPTRWVSLALASASLLAWAPSVSAGS